MFEYTQNLPSLQNVNTFSNKSLIDYLKSDQGNLYYNRSHQPSKTMIRQNSIIDQLFDQNDYNLQNEEEPTTPEQMHKTCSIEQIIKENQIQQFDQRFRFDKSKFIEQMLENKHTLESQQITSFSNFDPINSKNFQNQNSYSQFLEKNNLLNTTKIQSKLIIASLPSKQDINDMPQRPNLNKPFLRKSNNSSKLSYKPSLKKTLPKISEQQSFSQQRLQKFMSLEEITMQNNRLIRIYQFVNNALFGNIDRSINELKNSERSTLYEIVRHAISEKQSKSIIR